MTKWEYISDLVSQKGYRILNENQLISAGGLIMDIHAGGGSFWLQIHKGQL